MAFIRPKAPNSGDTLNLAGIKQAGEDRFIIHDNNGRASGTPDLLAQHRLRKGFQFEQPLSPVEEAMDWDAFLHNE